MSGKKIIRCAIVGTGNISRLFAEGARTVSGFEITAIYSRNLLTGQSFCNRIAEDATAHLPATPPDHAQNPHINIRIFTDFNELLLCDTIDAVYIASPNTLHFSQSLDCLQHGKHVLCEKPVTVLPSELHILQNTAAQHKLIFLEAVTLLHLPQLDILKKALTQIGQIREAFITYCQFSSKYAALQKGDIPNIFNPQFATGALMDIGVYCVNAAVALFGEPQTAAAQAVFVQTGADGCGSAVLTYPELNVTLAYSKTGQGIAPSEFRGDKGTVTVDLISLLHTITLYEHNKEPVTLFKTQTPRAHAAALACEAEHFVHFIRHPEQSASEYSRYTNQSQQNAAVMNRLRKSAGICFPGYTE